MASVYSVYYGETDRTRALFDYSVTTLSETQSRITVRSRLQGKNNYGAGYRITSKISSTTKGSEFGYLPSLYTDWHTFIDTGSSYTDVTRTHSDQPITVSSSYAGEGSTVVNPGSKSGDYSTTVTVPAKPSYTVSYNANGGSGAPSSQTKWYSETLTLSSTAPTRTGYNFNGWNTKSDGSGTSYSAGGSYTANTAVTLYAKWTLKTYTVSYNANEGSGAPASQVKTYGQTLTLSTTVPTRTGYNFVAWYPNQAGTGSTYYAPGGSYTANAAVTLYAKWSKITYTVSYNANGGSGSVSSQTKTYGENLTLRTNAYTKTGSNFTGWNTAANGSGTSYSEGGRYTANAAATMYAQWETITYTVSYNANGGTGAPSNGTKTYGQSYSIPSTTPTKTGYNFGGWSGSNGVTYSAGGTIASSVNQNVTLTAIWTALTYNVTYSANGGTGAPATGTKTYGVAYTIPSTVPTKTGYNFTGWLDSTSGTTYQAGGKIASNVNRAVSLTAQWSIKTYSVTYSANGGSGAPAAGTKTYGVPYTISSTTPTKTGYNFGGWSGSNGVTYSAGGTIASSVNQNVTLTAIWTLKTYTVSYNANGGSGAPQSQLKYYGQALPLSSTVPTRTNYSFAGWATSQSATTATYQAGDSYTTNAAVTLYAVWETAYTPPKIYYQTEGRIPIVRRLASNPTWATIRFDWSIFDTGSTPTVNLTIKYRLSSSTGDYVQLWGDTVSTTSGSVTQTVQPTGGFSESETYSIRIAVYDGTRLSAYYGVLSTGFFVFNISNANKGKSIGIGMAAVETDVPTNGRADFGMDVHFDGYTYFGGTRYNLDNLFFKSGETYSSLLGASGYCTTGSTSIVLRIQMPKSMANVTPTLTALTGRIRHVNGGYADGYTGDWMENTAVTVTYSKASAPNELVITLTKEETFKRTSTSTTAITTDTPVFATMTPTITFT